MDIRFVHVFRFKNVPETTRCTERWWWNGTYWSGCGNWLREFLSEFNLSHLEISGCNQSEYDVRTEQKNSMWVWWNASGRSGIEKAGGCLIYRVYWEPNCVGNCWLPASPNPDVCFTLWLLSTSSSSSLDAISRANSCTCRSILWVSDFSVSYIFWSDSNSEYRSWRFSSNFARKDIKINNDHIMTRRAWTHCTFAWSGRHGNQPPKRLKGENLYWTRSRTLVCCQGRIGSLAFEPNPLGTCWTEKKARVIATLFFPHYNFAFSCNEYILISVLISQDVEIDLRDVVRLQP